MPLSRFTPMRTTLKLKDLKHVINTDLTLYDMNGCSFYAYVSVNSQIFEHYEDFEVVSIRDYTSCTHINRGIVISIRQ